MSNVTSVKVRQRFLPAPLPDRLGVNLEVRMRTRLTPNGVRLLCGDNPVDLDSVKIALMTLSGMPLAFSRHRWAVLGDMEHGGIDDSADHQAIGRFCAEQFLDRLVCVGSLAMHFAAGAIEQGMEEDRVFMFRTAAQTVLMLRESIQPGDVALIKADGESEIVDGLCSD
jgi:UDP-N-acetylmuramyl pentapeptide synthase